MNIVYLFADGTAEKDKRPYEQIQLRVINKTNEKIKLYFNALYRPFEIKAMEELITMKTPIDFDYPGYFVVEYLNGPITLCKFRNPVTERKSTMEHYFSVIIKENEIKIVEGISDEEIASKDDNSWYWGYRKSYDSIAILLEGDINIVFKNNINEIINLYLSDPYNNYNHFKLLPNSEIQYKINKDIFYVHNKIEVWYRGDGEHHYKIWSYPFFCLIIIIIMIKYSVSKYLLMNMDMK
jgi:extradiol dioxygenase family protein